jgi:creatinine amidohydrolase
MILHQCTWPAVEAYLQQSTGIVVPMGSTEQHGPTGLIGTDSMTAQAVAHAMADLCGALVGPTLTLGPAQFNLAFPGTVSLRPGTLVAVIIDYVASLARQGFRHFYFLNGHGGNLAPAQCAFQEVHADRSLARGDMPALCFRLRSWWDYPQANALRQSLYGAAEGMHGTPSEVAITRALTPDVCPPDTLAAPKPLDAAFIKAHGGDNHDDADRHRAQFPDGRVGSHSALGQAEHGAEFIRLAAEAAAQDYLAFLNSGARA